MKKPIVALSFITIMSFVLLYFYRTPRDMQILYVGGALLAINIITYYIINLNHIGDEYLFVIQSMLVTLGVLMICRLDYKLGIKQMGWYLVSICGFYVAFFGYTHMKFLAKLKWVYLGLAVFLFMVTLLFGKTIAGAKNWIIIGNFTMQPSEIIKLLYVFYLATYFGAENRDKKIFKINERYIVTLVTYIFMGFLILQREWGSLVLFFITYMLLMYIYEKDWKLFAANICLAGIVGIVGVMKLYHIQVRIENWINPWADISNKGYQITQSLFAIASGGFFGTGIGLGKPGFIPEVHSDFIFSAICEEMGIFGGVAVILLFFLLVYRGFKIILTLNDGFDRAVALGITIMLAIQTFIIIGGVIKLIPLTGITLPFVSYGGSSLLISIVSVGILQAISAKQMSLDKGGIKDE